VDDLGEALLCQESHASNSRLKRIMSTFGRVQEENKPSLSCKLLDNRALGNNFRSSEFQDMINLKAILESKSSDTLELK